MAFFKLLGFAPDADPSEPGVLTDCDMLVPTLRGFEALPADADTGNETAPTSIASIQAFPTLDPASPVKIVAGSVGTTSKIYTIASGSYTDASGTAGTYSATANARWVFASYNNVIYAAQKGDVMLKDTGSTFTKVTGAPQALVIENVLDFVMAFNINDGGAVYGDDPNRWWCSAAGNPGGGVDSWTADVATQATTGLLTDTEGAILAGRRVGSNMVAFKNSSAYLGRYVDTPIVWDWSLIPGEGLGAFSQQSVVDVEGFGLMWIGTDNIYRFDGARALPIGNNRVAYFLFDNLDIEVAFKIIGLHDRQRSRVFWWFPSIDGNQALDKFLCYNYRSDAWGFGVKTITYAFLYQEPGVTYDGLANITTTYDALSTAPYDSAFAAIGTTKPAIMRDDKIFRLEGTPANASNMTTGSLGFDEAPSALIRVRPRFATAPTTGTQDHYYRNVLGETANTSQTGLSISNGAFDHVWNARWHQFKHSYTGDVEVLGLDVEYEPDGEE